MKSWRVTFKRLFGHFRNSNSYLIVFYEWTLHTRVMRVWISLLIRSTTPCSVFRWMEMSRFMRKPAFQNFKRLPCLILGGGGGIVSSPKLDVASWAIIPSHRVRGNTPNHPKITQTTSKPPQTSSKPSQTTFLTPRICFYDIINDWRRNLKAFLLRWPAMLAPNHHQTTPNHLQTTSKPSKTTFLTPRICFCDSINKWRRNLKAYLLRWPAMLAPCKKYSWITQTVLTQIRPDKPLGLIWVRPVSHSGGNIYPYQTQ